MAKTWHYHRCGESFYAHGSDVDAQAYLKRINDRLTSHTWLARAMPGDVPRGVSLADELAKLAQRKD